MKMHFAAALLVPVFLVAQPSAFEVASVKPSRPDDLRGSFYGFSPGGLDVTNGTLKGIIQMAYEVPDFQISGGPGWINSDRFNISAKAAGPESADPKERIQNTRLRLQALLAERFRLEVHRETREIPEYALVIARTGLKITEAASSPETRGTGTRVGCGDMTGTRTTMANLAFALTRQLRRPVVDRTGLDGKYDFQFEWAPEAPCGGPPPAPGSDAPPDLSERPSIFTALEERLGLKLEATKGPVEVIVIDRAEKADAN
jgi:bla regulator protein blaR1